MHACWLRTFGWWFDCLSRKYILFNFNFNFEYSIPKLRCVHFPCGNFFLQKTHSRWFCEWSFSNALWIVNRSRNIFICPWLGPLLYYVESSIREPNSSWLLLKSACAWDLEQESALTLIAGDTKMACVSTVFAGRTYKAQPLLAYVVQKEIPP